MADDEKKARLGRGLAALLGDAGDEDAALERAKGQRLLALGQLKPSRYNPRKKFLQEELDELAQSVREHGVLQPILVRNVSGASDEYEIIAGERRWRAAQIAGLSEVPVLLLEVDDQKAMEIAVIENVQRADLNILEEAQGYAQLIREFDYTHEKLSRVLAKNRTYISNALRILKLPSSVHDAIQRGTVTAGHARALLGVPNPVQMVQRIEEEGLSVRMVEAMTHTPVAEKHKRKKAQKADIELHLAREFSELFEASVSVCMTSRGSWMTIRCRNDEELLELIEDLRDTIKSSVFRKARNKRKPLNPRIRQL